MLKIEMYGHDTGTTDFDADKAVAFWRLGCHRWVLWLEDVIVTYHQGRIHAYDAMSGTYYAVVLTPAEIEALLALSISGEGEEHYATLANAIEGWPSLCCPVP